MTSTTKNKILIAAVIAAAIGGGYYAWRNLQASEIDKGIAHGNGRIEAVEIDVATKTAGRLSEIFVDEGDFVTAGQPLARMDTRQMEAQLRQAQAQARRADVGIETAKALVAQRQAEKRAAEAALSQKRVLLQQAERRLVRSQQLSASSTISQQSLEDDGASTEGARAAVAAAEASSAAADAGISYANAQVIDAQAAADAARAAIESIETELADSTLKAPRDGRIQFRVAQPGEVVAAGGRVLNLVDLGEVYMSFFLPTDDAGRLAIGSDALIRLDALPNSTIPAKISFVANVAQFTPKTVETQIEREKLMFRIKARVSPELLQKYIQFVKTGLPGVAYVRTDPAAAWPEDLSSTIVQ